MGIEAAKAALADAGLEAKDIDLVICATSTPDFTFPSTATQIQHGLGNYGGTASICRQCARASSTGSPPPTSS
jgi:3-oxoacyl-[acyl-carrier-protein] synthase-3